MPARSVSRLLLAFVSAAIAVAGLMLATNSGEAQSPAARAKAPRTKPVETGEAQWIWLRTEGETVRESQTGYFRKAFNLRMPIEGTVEITCQDGYELFVNGRKIGSGSDWRVLDKHDIAKHLVSGRNVVAVKAEFSGQGTPGLVARVIVRGAGGTFISHSTGESWKASDQEISRWNWPSFADGRWTAAKSLGEFGRTAPWNDRVRPADGTFAGRFNLPRDFSVERIAAPNLTGSLIGMAFDERGRILVSQEGEGIARLEDGDGDGLPEKKTILCDEITNCQGMLAVGGDLYVVGQSGRGAGLYWLTQAEDGSYKASGTLLEFKGGITEHGPHALTLGPDGWIYVLVGNHASVQRLAADESAEDGEFSAPEQAPDDSAANASDETGEEQDTSAADADAGNNASEALDDTSPYHHAYEGDLVQPRYEDAGGHAVGIKAPGGVIARVTLDGRQVEMFAGGLRNAYDMAFNRDGELFTYDSDMEWDEGLPWYRPTRMLHVTAGAEFGWRSGWAKWPEYYLDSLPPVVETGRGSPTGMEFYDHHKFPASYHGAAFVGDWTQGRILAVRLKPDGGSFQGTVETFVEGKPLNITDLAVGPDGWLYFCTGGRGTEGGVYRVIYDGRSPAQPSTPGIRKATAGQQFHSAFGRELVAKVQSQLGEDWDHDLPDLVADTSAKVDDRVHGLTLMHLYGPFPTTDLLLDLSEDRSEEIRAKAAWLMGMHPNEKTQKRLEKLLADEDVAVRRIACESLQRAGQAESAEALLKLLEDPNRHVRFAAMRALQQIPTQNWQDAVLDSTSPMQFNHGCAALLAIQPDLETAEDVLHGGRRLLEGFVSDADFIDLLRVMQLGLHHGAIRPDDARELRDTLSPEYPARTDVNPTGGRRMNRELVRLLVYLQDPTLSERLIEQIRSRIPADDKLHVATYARFLQEGWTMEQKFVLLDVYEQAALLEGGYSLPLYIENFARDFASGFSPEENSKLLGNASKYPSAALGAMMNLPLQLDAESVSRLQKLDAKLSQTPGEPARKLQIGIAAVFGRNRDPQGMAYLRDVFDREPERRATIAMALAQDPNGPNWAYLIRALPVLDGPSAIEVLQALQNADLAPQDPAHVREVILAGLRLGNEGGEHAVALLEHWFQTRRSQTGDAPLLAMQGWQEWFAQAHPDLPPPTLPVDVSTSKWNFEDLARHLSKADVQGDPRRGQQVFTKAQCVKCHRFDNKGEAAGPDLSTISRRFQKKEVLESVLFPSQVISDQYKAQTVVTTDGRQFTGIVGDGGTEAIILLQSNGQKLRIPKKIIGETAPHAKSAMPEGLFNDLALEEIEDLFAYLYQSETISRRSPAVRR